MTIGLHRTFFLKKKIKVSGETSCTGLTATVPHTGGQPGHTHGPCWLATLTPATGNTAYVLLCTISNSLLLENTVLYKNMTVSLENNIYFFFY